MFPQVLLPPFSVTIPNLAEYAIAFCNLATGTNGIAMCAVAIGVVAIHEIIVSDDVVIAMEVVCNIVVGAVATIAVLSFHGLSSFFKATYVIEGLKGKS